MSSIGRRKRDQVTFPAVLTVERRRGGAGPYAVVSIHAARGGVGPDGRLQVSGRCDPRVFSVVKTKAIPGDCEGLELDVLQIIDWAVDGVLKDGLDPVRFDVNVAGVLSFKALAKKAGG